MKKLTALILTLCMLSGILIGCAENNGNETDTVSESQTEVQTEAAEDEFKAVLRFTVASDVHIDLLDTAKEEERLAELFVQAYEFAESGADGYSSLDATVFVGDVSNTGSKKTLEKFKDICDAGLKEGTTPIYMAGNHEFLTQATKTLERFEKVLGAKPQDHLVINGVHFIYISSNAESEGYHYDDETVAWLEKELEAAAAENPDMPIFVFQHVPVKNTVVGSDYAGQSDITAVLAKYPQVIDFSGHSHNPITDPKAIHQGLFTSVTTGTLSYFAMYYSDINLDVFPLDDTGTYIDQRATRDGNSYWIVEVDAEGNTMLYGYDIDTKALACSYYVPFTTDKKDFIYTDARWDKPSKPTFPEDAKAEIYNVGYTGFEIKFTQAECDDKVCYYTVNVTENGSRVKSEYVMSCYYYTPMPETLSYCCDGLEQGHEYEVTITPVSCLGKTGSDSISITVTTKTASAITDADIVDLQFTSDNTPYNAATGHHLVAIDNPEISTNTELGMTTVKLNGENSIYLYKFNKYYKTIRKSFTFELSFKADEIGTFMNPCSNCESGGMGYGFDKTGMLKMWVSVNGTYHILELGQIEANEFVHAVTTFDGQTIVCYLNGKEVARDEDAKGSLTGTGNPTSENLVIGGDPADKNLVEGYFKGEVYAVRVFSSVYSSEQVNELYCATMNK